MVVSAGCVVPAPLALTDPPSSACPTIVSGVPSFFDSGFNPGTVNRVQVNAVDADPSKVLIGQLYLRQSTFIRWNGSQTLVQDPADPTAYSAEFDLLDLCLVFVDRLRDFALFVVVTDGTFNSTSLGDSSRTPVDQVEGKCFAYQSWVINCGK